MNRVVKSLAVGLSVVGAVALCGCGSSKPGTTAAGGGGITANLSGAGSSFIKPVMDKWVSEYVKARGGEINYQGPGSGTGIKNMTARSVEFGCTDAFMTDEQLKAASEAKNGGDVLHLPLAMGGIVPAYNLPGVEEPLNFTGEILADIYLGKLTKWNDDRLKQVNDKVAGKLPDKEIAVCRRSDSSGSTNIFTDYLSKVSQDFKKEIGVGTSPKWKVGTGADKSGGVADFVKRTPHSIGYVELTYALQNEIAFGAVRNREKEFVRADLKSVSTAAANSLKDIPEDLRFSITDAPGAGSYPISGTTWAVVYVKQSGDTGKALAAFLGWVAHDGQKFAEGLKYAPLPEGLVTRIDEKLKLLTK